MVTPVQCSGSSGDNLELTVARMPHMLGSAARVAGAATRLGSPLAGAEKESEAWTAASIWRAAEGADVDGAVDVDAAPADSGGDGGGEAKSTLGSSPEKKHMNNR